MVVSCIASEQRKQEADLVLFTGGGTGGHVFPGIAVAQALAERTGVRLLWVGSNSGMERDIASRFGIPFEGVPSGKLRRYLSLRNLRDAFAVIGGIVRSWSIMRRYRPALVFSKGGYVSVPPVIAARLLRIPVVTHESDADPGLATRINSKFATRILVPYESTAAAFPDTLQERVVVTGNPVRREILSGRKQDGLEVAGFDPHDARPVVLFLGGSQGARQLNELVLAVLGEIRTGWRVIHQTGSQSSDLPLPACDPAYFRREFFGAELPGILACADLVVCRAGASTLWEAAAVEKPMILVPLSSGSRGDQLRNAEVFERAGAARVINSASIETAEFASLLEELRADRQLRERMGRNARQLIHIDSSDRIVTILEHMLDEQWNSQP